MNQYQITVRNPRYGSAWRIRTTSAAEFADISRELLRQASDVIKLGDLQTLWPGAAAAKWHAFGDDVFQSVLRWAHSTISRNDFDGLTTGRGILQTVSGHMDAAGWKEITCEIAQRIAKILIRLALEYLRTQFPVITAANALRAIAILDRLLSRPSFAS